MSEEEQGFIKSQSSEPRADALRPTDSEPSAARAFYLAMYEDDGGKWEAVDPRYHDVWVRKARRFADLVGGAS
jgi:hypothetical protein